MTPLKPHGIIAFRAQNVFSFLDSFEVSFTASSITRQISSFPIKASEKKPFNLVPALAFYGPNASGKSNIFKAMSELRAIVLGSFTQETGVSLLHDRAFKLAAEAPMKFEIELILAGVWHLYGFEVSKGEVTQEYLYNSPNTKKVKVFTREGMNFEIGNQNKKAWGAARTITRSNSLLLSATGRLPEAEGFQTLHNWFKDNLLLLDDHSQPMRKLFTHSLNENPHLAPLIHELVQAADLGITQLHKKEVDTQPEVIKLIQAINPDADQEGQKSFELSYSHDLDGKIVEFKENEESHGTNAWVALIGPVLDALLNSRTLMIDELGDRLHPALASRIIKLFQDPVTNPNFAQIMFNTHSVALLENYEGETLLERDQIYLVEKDRSGASLVTRLSDLSPRNDLSLAKNYMNGRFGAVPILDFDRYSAAIGKLRKIG